MLSYLYIENKEEKTPLQVAKGGLGSHSRERGKVEQIGFTLTSHVLWWSSVSWKQMHLGIRHCLLKMECFHVRNHILNIVPVEIFALICFPGLE